MMEIKKTLENDRETYEINIEGKSVSFNQTRSYFLLKGWKMGINISFLIWFIFSGGR